MKLKQFIHFTVLFFFLFLSFFPLNMKCYEGKPLFEFERNRVFRSGLVGFALHGSLSHFYYQFCEVILSLSIATFFLFSACFVGLLSQPSGWESKASVSRLFSLSRIGGWSLPKLPSTKQCGQPFGTAFIISFWGSCASNRRPISWSNWRQHFGHCWL